MQRNIDSQLLKWKSNSRRKVLLVRGARQVGKTYSIRELGRHFENFLEVNLEEHRDIHSFFDGSLDPSRICEKLGAYFSMSIKPKQTLLFFDEIQACTNAIRSLRFFYEKMPSLHVAAAGSLLEFALSEIPSYGVGRIQNLFMYPMSFSEFLYASGKKTLWEQISNEKKHNPVDPVFHKELLEHLRIFQVIGGMPEVVKTYIETRDIPECQKILDDIITNLVDDFGKYGTKSPVQKLQEVFYSCVHQAGNKFKFSQISNERSIIYKTALELLVQAGLAYKIHHTSANSIPLGGQINSKKFKILIFDSGIYQRISGLNLKEYITADFPSLINKGSLAEVFTGIQLIAAGSHNRKPEIYYWHREARSSNAEIDYVISINNIIIPIEVKTGTKGKMQSLYLFLKEKQSEWGIRVSSENFENYGEIRTIPLYGVELIYRMYG